MLAEVLDAYLRNVGGVHSAHHITSIPELPNGNETQDVEWIEFLQNSSDHWIFFTQDDRIRKNPAERAALRRAKLHGFVFASGFMKQKPNIRAARMLYLWPEVEKLVSATAPPAMNILPIKADKLGQLAL